MVSAARESQLWCVSRHTPRHTVPSRLAQSGSAIILAATAWAFIPTHLAKPQWKAAAGAVGAGRLGSSAVPYATADTCESGRGGGREPGHRGGLGERRP